MNSMHDASDIPAGNGGELLPASHAKVPPIYPEPSPAERTLSVSALVEQCQRDIQASHRGELSNEAYGLELLRRAIVQGDQDAWNGVQQSFGESVRAWLHGHPRREAASRLESEETYMAQAFERFRQAAAQQQIAFQTLSGAGVYLRASLHGVIVDRLRTSSLPREVSSPVPGEVGEPHL